MKTLALTLCCLAFGCHAGVVTDAVPATATAPANATPAATAPANAMPAATAPADAVPASAAPSPAAALAEHLQRLAGEAATAAGAALSQGGQPMRVEIETGQLDPRLKLAPCELVQPYLPNGTKPFGRIRIGLRCLQGAVRWNVYLPVTVKLFAPALVLAAPLPAGTVLEVSHLQRREVDLAASPDPALTQYPQALGRLLARPLAAGDTLRRNDLRARQFFSAGDVVRITAVGPGYAVTVEGQAMSPGVEGQPARVRVESGRVLSGMPSGERRMEITL